MSSSKVQILNALQSNDADALGAEEWLRLVEKYPYCEIFAWHYLRELYRKDDLDFENELTRLGLRLGDKFAFYDFMTAEEGGDFAFESIVPATDWFAQQEKQSDEQKESLQKLAQKLKAARLEAKKKQQEESEKAVKKTELKADIQEVNESEIVDLVREKKYVEALEILKRINLDNSKKSAYFAVQIRYLETVIKNKK